MALKRLGKYPTRDIHREQIEAAWIVGVVMILATIVLIVGAL